MISSLSLLDSRLEFGDPLKAGLIDFEKTLNHGKVQSRGTAYILFSKALQLSQLFASHENLEELWLNFLAHESFSLCIENRDPIQYNFETITQLVKSGKKTFELQIHEVDPNCRNLAKLAETIHTIFLCALGVSAEPTFYETILSSENTLCMIATTQDIPVACGYGTYVKSLNVFHINLIGRKIEYPSIHFVEIISSQINRLNTRFPDAQYLTLCVHKTNIHMITIYKELGFEHIFNIEKDSENEEHYFLGMKTDPKFNVQPPKYPEFRAAIIKQRQEEQTSKSLTPR